jgi:putative ABC transport system permease protein
VFKTTIASLLGRKRRLLRTSLAVLLGVAFMCGTMVLTDTVGKSFKDLFGSVFAGTDAYVRSAAKISGGNGPGGGFEARATVPDSLLPTVRSAEGVQTAEGIIQGYTQIVGKDGKAIGNPGRGAPTFGTNWSNTAKLNPFHVVEGAAPRANDEVVIDKASATKGKLRVGDSTKFVFQGPTQTLKVVGIAKFGKADSPLGASFAMFTVATAQRFVGQPGHVDAIAVLAKQGVSQEQARASVAKVVPSGIEVLTGKAITKEQQNDIQRGISFFSTFLLIFTLIAVLVGAFIIHNTFTILVAQRGREVALLRAVGASRRQVMGSVLFESVVVGVIAAVVGLIAGIILSVGLKAMLSAIGFGVPASGLIVTPRTVIAAFLVGVVVSVLSSLGPARRATRVSPVEAMREAAMETSAGLGKRLVVGTVMLGVGVAMILIGLFAHPSNTVLTVGVGVFLVFIAIAVLGPAIAGPVSRVIGAPLPRLRGMAGNLARENALRNPRRTSATASALMIGVGLVAFIGIFAASAKASLDDTIKKQFNGDFVVNTSGGEFGGLSPALESKLRALPEVNDVSAERLSPAQVDGSRTVLIAVDARSFDKIVNVDVRSGKLTDLDASSIAVRDTTATKKGWKLGQTIPVTFAQTGVKKLKLAATFHKRDLIGSYLVGLPVFEANVTPQFDFSILINKAPNVSATEARVALEKATADYPTAKVQDQTQFAKSQSGQIDPLLGLVRVMLALSIVIAMFGIYNTLALSIYERTRELGLLRAVGMTRRQMRSTVRWESVIIALFGALLGIAIGVFFGWLMVRATSSQGISQLRIPAGQLVFYTVAAGVIGVVAAIGPARRASRLDVLAAIATD